MVSMFQNAPVMPHLHFFEESTELRDESIKAGRLVSKSVDMVTIRQPGSKDDVTKEAGPWLATLPQNPNWTPEWVERAKAMYSQYKEGLEITQVGTHVRTWALISKAEAEMLLAAGIRTVEELALANEQSIGRIGIGGRSLKQKAQAWLDSSTAGAGAAELEALRAQTAKQTEQIAELMAKLNLVLTAQAVQAEPAAPTTPAAEPAAPEAPKDDFLG